MPFVTAPNIIEQSDFTGGYAPDPEAAALEAGQLIDTLNVLPDPAGSGALQVRKGFRRIRQELTGDDGRYIKHIFRFRGNDTSYLICVLVKEAAEADNVQLWAIDLDDFSKQRIDDSGVTWSHPEKNHWGVGVQEVYYGGSPGNDVYSWDPATDTWDATANVGNWKTVVDAVDGAVTTATEYGRDYAFNGKEKAFYNSDVFTPARSIRYDTWEDGQRYRVGDRVSNK